jgi:hypothetical protein
MVDWSTKSKEERMSNAMNILIAKHGLSINGAAGVVGNLWKESGLIPNRIEGSQSKAPMKTRSIKKLLTKKLWQSIRGIQRNLIP